jgi:hypothetical protein
LKCCLYDDVLETVDNDIEALIRQSSDPIDCRV